MIVLEIASLVVFAFFLGGFAGQYVLRKAVRKQSLVEATIPLGQLIADFRDFATNVEGGALSAEAEGAIKMLEEHAAERKLPERPKTKPSAGGRSTEKMYQAEKDACRGDNAPVERGNVIKRWHKKGFVFPDDLRIIMLNCAADQEWRDELRQMFDEQDESQKLLKDVSTRDT